VLAPGRNYLSIINRPEGWEIHVVFIREGPVSVCEVHQGMRLNVVFLTIFEWRPEIGSTPAMRIEHNFFPDRELINVVNLGITVNNDDLAWPDVLHDAVEFSSELIELFLSDRPGRINASDNDSCFIALFAWKVNICANKATVRSRPVLFIGELLC
jgi:hypothetical protein